MRPAVPTLLSFNGGYVDTIGCLSLQGLFTAHVTGNFVTIGAAPYSVPQASSPSCRLSHTCCGASSKRHFLEHLYGEA